VARIEVAQDDLGRLSAAEVRQRVVAAFKELGYAYVCLDLEGYRTGSMNATLDRERSADVTSPQQAVIARNNLKKERP
jgi:uncharacterized protein